MEDIEDATNILQVQKIIRWCDEKPSRIKNALIADKKTPARNELLEDVLKRLSETSEKLFRSETDNVIQDRSYQMLKVANFLETICYSNPTDEVQQQQKNYILRQLEEIATQSENIAEVQKKVDEANKIKLELTTQLRDSIKKRQQAQQELLDRTQRETQETKELKGHISDLEFNINLMSRVMTRLIVHKCPNIWQDQEMRDLIEELNDF